jgi:four helix bundle protein
VLAHRKLKVYGKALAVVASLTKHSGQWNKRHSVVDQLCRASESIVLNLAEAVRVRQCAHKQQLLDYAVGSSLECAACVDIAVIKRLLASELAGREKRSLCEVVRMLIGLRRSWETNAWHEEPSVYGDDVNAPTSRWYFAHEPLEVYQVSLNFLGWFNALPAGAELASRLYRLVDNAATSSILNLAEGHGRTGEGDRFRFVERAEASAVKAAAYLDLCVSKSELEAEQREPGMELLSRVIFMLRALSDSFLEETPEQFPLKFS